MKISIVLCTYNPDINIILSTLKAIDKARNFYNKMELLLIDNLSDVQIVLIPELKEYLKDKDYFNYYLEEKPGLTNARIRGIKESTGDLIIFIDDDNFVGDDYFVNAIKIANEYPNIGAYNGQVELKFENTPPDWTKKYWNLLAYNRFKGNYWSNQPFSTVPNGAGLCVRRSVAQYYVELHEQGKRKFTFDRVGKELISGGDQDLAMCACDIGLGMGVFDSLYLDHMIPDKRLTLEYISKLVYGISFSGILLRHIRKSTITNKSWKRNIYEFISAVFYNKEKRLMYNMEKTGERKAKALIKKWDSEI